jgi:hypothetical protein
MRMLTVIYAEPDLTRLDTAATQKKQSAQAREHHSHLNYK